jgi:hypothetical protein
VRSGLAIFSVLALVLALVAARPAAGFCLQTVVAMGAATTWQWRFVPGRRRRDLTVLVVAALVSTVVVSSTEPWTAAAVTAFTVAVVLLVTWPLTRLSTSLSVVDRAREVPRP